MPIDHRRLDTTVKTTRASYEAALARLEHETIRHVADEMCGQEANRVHAVLVSRVAARLPCSDLDEHRMQSLASAIARGDYQR